MDAFTVILLSLLAGILLRRFRVFGGESGYALNRFVIYISLPAMVLKQIHDLPLGEAMGVKAAALDAILRGGARDVMEQAGIQSMHVSISHCRSYAVAYVVAEGSAGN